MENSQYSNQILNDKDSIHSDNKQTSISKALTVGASFIAEFIYKGSEDRKYNSHIAEHKLEVVETKLVSRINSKTKEVKEVPQKVYFTDNPLIKTTLIKKETLLKKENKKKVDTKSKTAKVISSREEVINETTYIIREVEQKRGKFVSVSKAVKNFWSCMLVYYRNDLGTFDKANIENIKNSDKISKFIYLISETINYDKMFNKNVFTTYENIMNSKQNDCKTSLATTVSSFLSHTLNLGDSDMQAVVNIFVKFFYAILQKFCVYRAIHGITISIGLFRSFLWDFYIVNMNNLKFDMHELDKNLKKDNNTIIKTIVKSTTSKPIIENEPKVIPTTTYNLNENLKDEEYEFEDSSVSDEE